MIDRPDVKNSEKTAWLATAVNSFLAALCVLAFVLIGTVFSVFVRNTVLCTILADVSMLCFVIPIYYKHFKPDRENCLQRYESGRTDILPAMLLAYLFIWFFLQCMGSMIITLIPDPVQDQYQAAAAGADISYMVLSILLAPVIEEYIMRGLCYGFLRRCMPMMPAAIISGVMFGLCHGTVAHTYVGAMLGAYFAMVYEYTGSLKYSIGMHFIGNLLSVLVGYLPIPEVLFTNPLVCTATNAGCIAAIFWFYLKMQHLFEEQKRALRAENVELTRDLIGAEDFAALFPGSVRLDGDEYDELIEPGSCFVDREGEDERVVPEGPEFEGVAGLVAKDGRPLVMRGARTGGRYDDLEPLSLAQSLSAMNDRENVRVLDKERRMLYQGSALGARSGCSKLTLSQYVVPGECRMLSGAIGAARDVAFVEFVVDTE